MNYMALLKRLQQLEDQHGPHFDVITIQVDGEDCAGHLIPIVDKEITVDLIEREGQKFFAIMPKSYYEEIAPKGIQHRSV